MVNSINMKVLSIQKEGWVKDCKSWRRETDKIINLMLIPTGKNGSCERSIKTRRMPFLKISEARLRDPISSRISFRLLIHLAPLVVPPLATGLGIIDSAS